MQKSPLGDLEVARSIQSCGPSVANPAGGYGSEDVLPRRRRKKRGQMRAVNAEKVPEQDQEDR